MAARIHWSWTHSVFVALKFDRNHESLKTNCRWLLTPWQTLRLFLSFRGQIFRIACLVFEQYYVWLVMSVITDIHTTFQTSLERLQTHKLTFYHMKVVVLVVEYCAAKFENDSWSLSMRILWNCETIETQICGVGHLPAEIRIFILLKILVEISFNDVESYKILSLY